MFLDPARSVMIRHTSHVTRHTSHVTRHMSHVTRHTSHVTLHTSHVTRHTSHLTPHTSNLTPHTSHSYQPQRSFSHTRGGHVSAHHVQPSPRTTQYAADASACVRMRQRHVTRLPGTTQRAGTLPLRSTCTPPSTTVRTPTAVIHHNITGDV